MIFRWAQFKGERNEHGVLKSASTSESNLLAVTKIINVRVNDNVTGQALAFRATQIIGGPRSTGANLCTQYSVTIGAYWDDGGLS
jgi:hypothetical protein